MPSHRLFLQNGDLYDREFKKGEITGKSLYIWSNKQQYKGDFVNDISGWTNAVCEPSRISPAPLRTFGIIVIRLNVV